VVSYEHVVEVSQFSRSDLEAIFRHADFMRTLPRTAKRLEGHVLATIFYEPSTRTRLSFESAMLRLGGGVISTENAREFSSAIKGETVEDTVRIVAGYADAIVIRHYERGAAARAAAVSPVPILNAGLKVALVGDLKYGRTARSLALLMRETSVTELVFVAPPSVPMGDDIRRALDAAGIHYRDEQDLNAALGDVDVVYQTRIQKERFASPEEYEAVKGSYVINRESMSAMKRDAILLHPLPRVDEIAIEVDGDPRAAYFRQAHNGVFIRMALLDMVINPAYRDGAPS
jgi:aspartate carbamoyltransferase catalytic subunit